MSANFTPNRGAYTELKPFRFWCQKVLPLVYDDSLSYYELLCKVVDYLNKTMEDVETLEGDVTSMYTAFEQLQGYVNNYFDQNFPDLVSDKLDKMAEDGTLTALITPVVTDTIDEQLPGEVAEKIGDTVAGQIGPVVSNQIGPVVSNQIGPVVADWLEDNMSATTPAVDRTLSILNAAADAAFTGARIDNLDDAVGYEHISDVGAIITTADPYAFNFNIIINNARFSDNQSHTYKMLVIPVATGDKYRINAHKISIANVSADHFAVTYAFCAKYIGDPDTDIPYYLPTTYNTVAVVDDIVTVPEINIPTGQFFDETTGYLVVITANIEDPVYKVTDGFASESEVTALRVELNDIIDKEFTLTNVANLEDVATLNGINFGTSGSYPGYVLGSDNANFDSYYFYGNDGEEIYFESSSSSTPAYISVTYGAEPSKQWVTIAGNAYSMQCSNSARIRNSDNNLPTETNKLNISNCIVCITVTAGTTCNFYINRKKLLSNEIELNNNQIEQVINAIPAEKTCKVQYVTPSESYSSEQLNIYIPQKAGYSLYEFTRTTIANANADVWRINQIKAVSDDLSLRFVITYGGEIEFALKLQGRSDFSGGRAHGDEVLTEAEFWIDGAIVNPASLTALTDFNVLKCCEVTNVFDPNDSTTIIAKHGREYIFDENGFDLSQTLEWTAIVPVTQLYMAMYTPRKTYNDLVITNKAIFDTDFTVFTPTNPVQETAFNGAKSVMLYSDASAHYSGFELKQYPTGYAGGDKLELADNGGNNYNKIYAPVITSLSNPIDTVIGDRLKSVAHFFVRVGN